MNAKLLSSILLVNVFCLISLTESFSQGEQNLAANELLEEALLPNYHYEYVPDFTYDEIKKRVEVMDVDMSFELNNQVFSFIQYFICRDS
jgi:membrane-bound lytic murein transglycosylase D